MNVLAWLVNGLYGPPKAKDALGSYLRRGKAVYFQNLKVVLDKGGVVDKWQRYECLHLEHLSIRFQDDQ